MAQGYWLPNPSGGGDVWVPAGQDGIGMLSQGNEVSGPTYAPAPDRFSRLTGTDPAIQWVNSMIQDNLVWSPGSDVANPGWSNTGVDANVALMGAFRSPNTAPNIAIEETLRSIATAAGKPDFDWTLAKAKAAQQHYQQSGQFYTAAGSPHDTSWPGLVALIAQNAGDPAIAQAWQQHAPAIQQSLQDAQTQYSTAEDNRDSRRHQFTAAALAAPFAAGGLASLFGAGAAAPAAATAPAATAAPAAGAVPTLAELTAAGGIPELGMVANPATAAAATAGGVPASVLAGGAGAIGLNGVMGNYSFPLGSVVGSALEMYGANKQANTLEDMMKMAIDSDLWRKEQPKYFQPLYDTVTKGISGTAYGDATAKAAASNSAARGYFGSPNMVHDIAKGLDINTNARIGALTPLAMGRGESPSVAQIGPQVANAQNNVFGALGYGLESIYRGNQPNSVQQFQGTPQNQNLMQYLQTLA